MPAQHRYAVGVASLSVVTVALKLLATLGQSPMATNIVAGLRALLPLCAACGTTSHVAGTTGVEGADSFPSEWLSGCVSYSLQILVVTIVAERESPVQPIPGGAPEDKVVTAYGTLRVDRTIWSAPGTPPVRS